MTTGQFIVIVILLVPQFVFDSILLLGRFSMVHQQLKEGKGDGDEG